jgi:CHAT domain-containing protein/tetratricopeptide (TPR) repeat protein
MSKISLGAARLAATAVMGTAMTECKGRLHWEKCVASFVLPYLLTLVAAISPGSERVNLSQESHALTAQHAGRKPGNVLTIVPIKDSTKHLGDEKNIEVLSSRAQKLITEGKYKEASAIWERMLSLSSKVLAADSLLNADGLNVLGQLCYMQGAYTRAEAYFKRALAIREKNLGSDHATVADSLYNLAILYKTKGVYSKAEPLHLRALAIRERSLGSDHPDTAASLDGLARLYTDQGAYSKAEPLYLRALAILEKNLGGDHPDTATSLNNLAELQNYKGAYNKVEPLLIRALAIRERSLGSDHPDTAGSLNNLAILYSDQGAYVKAEPLFLRALAIFEKSLGGNHPATATNLNNLAVLYQEQGAFKKVGPLLIRALAIRERSLGRDHPDTAASLINLAVLYIELGSYSKVEPLLLRALSIQEKSLGKYHSDTASGLNDLAYFYEKQSAYSKAEPLLLRALAIRERSLGSDHPDTAASLIHLAINLYARNNYKSSILYLQNGVTMETRFIHRELPYLSINRRMALLRSIGRAHELIFSFPGLVGDSLSFALAIRLNRQGLLSEIERRQAELAALQGPQQQLRDELSAVTIQLSSASLLSPQRRALRTRQEELEQQFYRLLPELKLSNVAIADVASALPAGSALVELQKYQPFDGRKPMDQLWGDPRYFALILRPDQSITAVQLGPAAPIESSIQKALQASSENTTDAQPLWGRVSDLVLKPLMPALTGSSQWFLSPDAELNRVPFAALPAPQDPSKPLAQAIQLRLLTTGRELLRLQQPIKAATVPVVMANPAFERDGRASRSANLLASNAASQSRSADLAAKVWKPLPGSELEGRQVSAQLGTAPLTGVAASTRQLQQLKSPRVLHIASHGFFVGDSDTKPSEPLAMLQDQTSLLRRFRGEDPQLRSGLVLAGANQPDADPTDDGYLTAAEAAALKLDGTELVVLSACSTGQGTIRTGEGVYGLQRALAVAGARSTLLSLWKVDDVATAEFMRRFYSRLKAGEPRSDAVAATQEEFRSGSVRDAKTGQRWDSPYYWAAWQLVGDWRPIKGL